MAATAHRTFTSTLFSTTEDTYSFPRPPTRGKTLDRASRGTAPALPNFSFPLRPASNPTSDTLPPQPLFSTSNTTANASQTTLPRRHRRQNAVHTSPPKCHAQLFPPVPEIPQHFKQSSLSETSPQQLDNTPQQLDSTPAKRSSGLKFQLVFPNGDIAEETTFLPSPEQSPSHSTVYSTSIHTSKRHARDFSASLSSCPTLIPDHSPLPTPVASATSAADPTEMDVEDEMSPISPTSPTSPTKAAEREVREVAVKGDENEEMMQDYATFKKMVTSRMDIDDPSEQDMEEEDDDDDDEEFWHCRGLGDTEEKTMSIEVHGQDQGQGREQRVMDWMRGCEL